MVGMISEANTTTARALRILADVVETNKLESSLNVVSEEEGEGTGIYSLRITVDQKVYSTEVVNLVNLLETFRRNHMLSMRKSR